MSKINFSYMVVIMMLVGMLGMGLSTNTVFANEDNTETTDGTLGVELPMQGTDNMDPIDPNKTEGEAKALSTIVNKMYDFATYISTAIFGVSVIMIVWAGFKYATSQGESKVTEQAKMQIITAGIGIGVALFAMVIVKVFAEIYL